MAETLEQLSRQHDTLASIRGIVHTMKTLSAINATPYEHAASAIEAYHGTILQGFAAFAHRTGELSRRSVYPAEHWVVVFGSDHGLCGNYNEVLASLVSKHCQATEAGSPRLLCVGMQMNDALVDQGLTPEQVLLPPASADGIGRLAGNLVTRLDAADHGRPLLRIRVTLAYTQRGDKGVREPVTLGLLPLDETLLRRESRWPSRSLPDYTMAPESLLASLIRSHLFASLSRASAEAMVTENAARLALMQQAERSVDDRLEQVKGELRSVRQADITNELLDVITGFEALKKERKPAPEAPRRVSRQ
ncbi:MAG: F0F1 ATP synthase subunit gamma [Marinobacter sp.]|nr:F0F1 ATP synthase subunit gamma [Marinobacter sp.]